MYKMGAYTVTSKIEAPTQDAGAVSRIVLPLTAIAATLKEQQNEHRPNLIDHPHPGSRWSTPELAAQPQLGIRAQRWHRPDRRDPDRSAVVGTHLVSCPRYFVEEK